MLKVLLVLLVVEAALGYPRYDIGDATIRIIGGHDADIKDYPYQLALMLYDVAVCGAVLIDPQWALTAAHCVEYQDFDGFSIRAGSSNKSSGGQVVPVSNITVHPLFVSNVTNYDYTVLRLAEPVTINNAIPIKLPQQDEPVVEGEITNISGWGVNDEGRTSETLLAVEMPVVDFDDCKQVYGERLTEAMICAGLLDVGGKGSCLGDSGGPLVIDGRLAGLVSWAFGCGLPGYPEVYANVAHAIDWIHEVISEPARQSDLKLDQSVLGPKAQ